MPRWKALPEGLDPQVREFANQLRRLVDRSGLSVAAVADRTGYSKTSWERYLNGRLLAPKGAVVALSDVTGTNPVHLTTMWELAERAWSRSEMRHDMTMEAIRISQARAALGEFGAPASQNAKSRKAGTTSTPPTRPGSAARPGSSGPGSASVPGQSRASESALTDTGQQRRAARPNTDAFDMTTNLKIPSELKARTGQVPSARSGQGSASAARTAPSRPAPGRPEHERDYANDFERGFNQGQSYNSPSASSASSSSARSGSGGAGGYDRPAGPGPGGARPGPPPPNSAPDRQRQRRKLTMFLAGVVGALLVIVAAVLLTSGDDKDKEPNAGKTPAASQDRTTTPKLPAGVKCNGKACEGKDPEAMGCGGEYAITSARGTVGTAKIEVRYSKTCGAAWARITGAAGGDKVTVSSDTSAAGRNGVVGAASTDAYTSMVESATADEARACATLKSGKKSCTTAE
ncbi:XRE family transcriptional regulator [Streptomyces sp. NBC_00237]|uniref:helix-turn-helix domain-containing protein n=1 Tax=Streptomyces sp. NBC_00237 TaxID=2975687 RepID=UPI0022567A6F|nr:XRE family transcriptional regulator [Streptomyces sp. NBC_00237]MCX5204710.1 XRE family transcriptional regulator [Streptomyces sp. NBC_00237]